MEDREESYRFIEEKLRKSNPTVWGTLSESDRRGVVSKYYNLRGVQAFGLGHVLELNSILGQNLATLVLGLLLGIFGNFFVTAVSHYLPQSPVIDGLFVLAFLGVVAWYMRFMDKTISGHLADHDVLDILLDMTRKETASVSAPAQQDLGQIGDRSNV